MTTLRSTDEQLIAVEKFKKGHPLKIAAFAGAGKTTTLKMLAESRLSRGVYLAFNKSIATEAKEKFPKSVDCWTTHAIAFRAIMPAYSSVPKMTSRVHARQLAEVMGFKDHVFKDAIRLNGIHQAYLVLGTVRRFCQSADAAIGPEHVPTYGRLLGANKPMVAEVRGWALEQAGRLWARMTEPRDDIPLGHDGYLKLWALGKPKIAADYILLDEAQDTNPVVLGVLMGQSAQIVYVGDRHQQIYEWRGAINAMEMITDCDEAALTQSFRFGADIADAASRVLSTLGEERHIRGNPAVASRISAFGNAKAVLARTNATVILEVLESIGAGYKPCVVGGTKELKRLLSDVYELKTGKLGVCPEFFGFENWSEVVEFSEMEEGQDIRTFVQLVEQYGEGKLWAAVKSVHDDETTADVILSTAHKSKGREWDSVRLAPDLANSRSGSHRDALSEVRLFYVAMTRARKSLIVAPEVLATFATDTWKKKQAERPSPATGLPPLRPQTPPRHKPSPPSPPFPRSPGVAQAGRPPTPPVPARPAVPPAGNGAYRSAPAPVREPARPRFWKRIVRLFG